MKIKINRGSMEYLLDTEESVRLDRDGIVLGNSKLYYEGNNWFFLNRFYSEEETYDRLEEFFKEYSSSSYINIKIEKGYGDYLYNITLGVDDIFDFDEYFNLQERNMFLVEHAENNIENVLIVDEEELNRLTKDLYSISSCGIWEDGNNSLIILKDRFNHLNVNALGFASNKSLEYLCKHFGYAMEDLIDLINGNLKEDDIEIENIDLSIIANLGIE